MRQLSKTGWSFCPNPVKNCRIITNPDVGHLPSCSPTSWHMVEACDFKRELTIKLNYAWRSLPSRKFLQFENDYMLLFMAPDESELWVLDGTFHSSRFCARHDMVCGRGMDHEQSLILVCPLSNSLSKHLAPQGSGQYRQVGLEVLSHNRLRRRDQKSKLKLCQPSWNLCGQSASWRQLVLPIKSVVRPLLMMPLLGLLKQPKLLDSGSPDGNR